VNKPTKKIHPGRKIHLPSGVWTYVIGKSYVNIRDPNGKRTNVDTAVLIGEKYEDIERAQWNRYFHIAPVDVKSYIEKSLIDNFSKSL